MSSNISKFLFFIVIGLSFNFTLVNAQSCNQPFFNSFTDRSTSSINIRWADTNTSPLGWEIEVVKRGNPRTMLPTTSLITTKQYTLDNLTAATTYEVYVRTICTVDKSSVWTGPALFTTVFTNPTQCQTNLPLKDNGTETFSIDVTETGILGQNIFIESVDMILEHDWPADLKISLESPSGDVVTLSNHNGTITDDFGDVMDTSCLRFTSFNANACMNLKENVPPYIGSFIPDGNLNNLGRNKSAKGIWKIIFFDRALKDVGNLKYLNINFNRENCVVPENFVLRNIGNNSVVVDWDNFGACTTVKLTLYSNGNKINEIFLNCKEQNISLKTIKGLLPNTDYEISISATCGNAKSIEGCKLFFTTTCEAATMKESFDTFSKCTEGCAVACNFNAPVWFNAKEESSQDWIIWDGKTDTENTGPTTDISGLGKYIYIENNPILCGSKNKVTLMSQCIDIKSNPSGCDMSFYYHMYGIDIESLALEISLDNRLTWQPLAILSGDQGDRWKRITLSLAAYDGLTGIFRFVGISGDGPIGDIAIDQIEFYKSALATGLTTFYVDADGDGYGVENEIIKTCSNIPPLGYAELSGDCDDKNPNINPGATEIQCNGVDENCNGYTDDAPEFNPISYSATIQNATCNGSHDGSITLDIQGGTSPYIVSWPSQNQGGSMITNIKEGIYYAEITDVGGCIQKTVFFQVNSNSSINVVTTEIIHTSCLGKSDGSIKIEHSTNNEPYAYIWSNGKTTKHISELTSGEYSLTVTDASTCTAVLSKILVNNTPSLISQVQSKKNPSCFGFKNGFISIITINGTEPYHYNWSTGDTTSIISNLGAENYSITVTDQNGCQSNITTLLTAPDSVKVVPVSIEDVRCYGEANGFIKTNTTGGTPPYTYLWTGVRTTDDIFNLPSGKYTITVTDALGCRSTPISMDVKQPDLFQINIDSIKASSCRLGKNGYISLSATGGTKDYSYAWSHTGLSSNTFSDLISGNYSVTAYDLFGCKSSIPTLFIPFNNVNILSELELINENKCFNERSGAILATIINGKAPYDYNWSHGVQYIKEGNVDTVSQLPSGIYSLTITDAEGCVGTSELVSIKEIIQLSYQISNVVQNICNTDSIGMIDIDVKGGAVPYTINWNQGTGESIKNLTNGLYIATITDINNCQKVTETIQISSFSDISISGQIMHDINNTSIGQICLDIYGAVGTYHIKWINRADKTVCIKNLSAGIYDVEITDDEGCIAKQSFEIENTSSTKESSVNKFNVFPNPTHNSLTISGETEIISTELLSSDGKTSSIKPEQLSSTEQNIDLSQLPIGMYYLKIFYNDGVSICKVIRL